MKRAMLMLPLLIAGCRNEPEVQADNASVAEVAQKVREAGGSDAFVRAGKWQSQVRITSFEMPGAPPELASAMKSMHQKTQVATTCLTSEQASRPKEDFFAGAGKDCRYHHFDMSGGKIDAMMQCTQQGMAQTMIMKGTYGPDDYRMQMSVKADPGVGPQGGMVMNMEVDANRVGECDAKQS
jgi:hypothetical protein